MRARHSIQALSTFSHPGERPSQEDHLLALQDKGILVLADGFGGASAGAQASKTACEAIRGFLVKEAGDLEATLPFVLRQYYSLAGNVLFNAVIHANQKVFALNKAKNVHEKGGTSLIAAFLDGDLLALANVGCCTAWLFRNGEAVELVIPRTYGRLIDPFHADQVDPNTQVPLIAVGMAEDVEPEISEYRIRSGDWLVLATDGMTPEAREALLALHRSGKSVSDAAREASSLLKSFRYTDNASVSLAFF